MDISIIIPTRNRMDSLPNTLDALLAQQFAGTFEIIVVDDGSTDQTAALARDKYPTVRLVRRERGEKSAQTNTLNQGPAAARNAGIRHATGTIIAFIDDDCIAEPNWLSVHFDHYTDSSVGMVGGAALSKTPNFFDKFDAARVSAVTVNAVRRICQPQLSLGVGTGNLSIRHTLLNAIGNFDESYITGADPHMVNTALATDYCLIVDPAAQVDHAFKHTLRSYLRRHFRRGAGSVRNDLQSGQLTLRRFLPIINPRLMRTNWAAYRKLWGGSWGDFGRFVTLFILIRILQVSGRLYYYLQFRKQERAT